MGESRIAWNPQLRLAISDVDETIADIYTPAAPEMVSELSRFIAEENGKMLMVTGGSIQRVTQGVVGLLEPQHRQNILVGHCNGAEIWGFTPDGDMHNKPFYSAYDNLFTDTMKTRWQQAVARLMSDFNLRPHPVQPPAEFLAQVGDDPRDIMLDDRGPQITLEVINGYNLTAAQADILGHEITLTHDNRRDLRPAIMHRATQLFNQAAIPVTPRLGGVFAVDFAISGLSKATSVQYVMQNPRLLAAIGLSHHDVTNPQNLEVWGDRFSVPHGGADRFMSEALSPDVRSIDFRSENPDELPADYNIVLWNGQHRLHNGLLEFLQSRHSAL